MTGIRRLEQRTTYAPDLADEWHPVDEDTQRAADRVCFTEADYRRFVRDWNAVAKKDGNNTRIRSVPNDEETST